LISGTLPQFFEKEALNLLNEMDPQGKTENYTSLLKKKDSIKLNETQKFIKDSKKWRKNRRLTLIQNFLNQELSF
jgi:hypothetical protein